MKNIVNNKIKSLLILIAIAVVAFFILTDGKNLVSNAFYTNDTYGFNLSVPNPSIQISPLEDGSRLCQVVTKTENGIDYLKSEKIEFLKPKKVRISFYEQEFPYSDKTFSGIVGYKLESFCRPLEIVRVVVFEKAGYLNLDSFVDRQYSDLEDSFVESAAGGGVIKLVTEVNGKDTPLVSLRGSSVMQNTTDQYYFEDEKYFYMLSHSYAKTVIDQGDVTDSFSRETIEKYNLALEIINGFNK